MFVLDMHFEGVVVVGKMDKVGAAVEGADTIERAEFIVMEEDDLEFGE